MEDGVEGAVALGTPRLGPGGGDGDAAEACAAGMRAPRSRQSFRPTKTALNRGAHNSMKRRARAAREQSGITLLRGE